MGAAIFDSDSSREFTEKYELKFQFKKVKIEVQLQFNICKM